MRLSLGLGCNYCTATAQGLVALPHKLIYSNSQLLWPIMNNMIILEPSLSSQPTYNLNETWDLNFHIFTATNSVSLQLQCLMWSRSKPQYATVCCTGSGVEEETREHTLSSEIYTSPFPLQCTMNWLSGSGGFLMQCEMALLIYSRLHHLHQDVRCWCVVCGVGDHSRAFCWL